MKKISSKFYIYLLFVMLGLAFVFPLVHSTYEGFLTKKERKNKKEMKKKERERKKREQEAKDRLERDRVNRKNQIK
jgi:hypothetical protein